MQPENVLTNQARRLDHRDPRRLAAPIGFEIVPRRWVVERTLAWLNRNCRLPKDYKAMIAKR